MRRLVLFCQVSDFELYPTIGLPPCWLSGHLVSRFFMQIFTRAWNQWPQPFSAPLMDWVRAESVPRYSSMEHQRAGDSNAADTTTTSALPHEAHSPIPAFDAWGFSGGSSAAGRRNSWDEEGGGRHGWPPGEPAPPLPGTGISLVEHDTVSAQGSSTAGAGSATDFAGRSSNLDLFDNTAAAFMPAAMPVARNGVSCVDSPLGAVYSTGTILESSEYTSASSGMVGGVHSETGFESSGTQGSLSMMAPTAFVSEMSMGLSGVGQQEEAKGEAGAAATARAAKAAPKKKPRGPRTPKKKAKAPAAPPARRQVRRKVKRPRPPEVSLGPNGRERAMAMLRALVDSPLSEEFHKPVVQLHPEVSIVVVRKGSGGNRSVRFFAGGWCSCE